MLTQSLIQTNSNLQAWFGYRQLEADEMEKEETKKAAKEAADGSKEP